MDQHRGGLDDNIPPKTSKRKVAEYFERTNPVLNKIFVILYLQITCTVQCTRTVKLHLYPYIQCFGFSFFIQNPFGILDTDATLAYT